MEYAKIQSVRRWSCYLMECNKCPVELSGGVMDFPDDVRWADHVWEEGWRPEKDGPWTCPECTKKRKARKP